MIIKGGCIKQMYPSCYQNININLKPENWNYLYLSIGGKEITKICNSNNLIRFEVQNIENKIRLFVNNIEYYSSNDIFEYEINIILIDLECEDTDIITYNEGIIIKYKQ